MRTLRMHMIFELARPGACDIRVHPTAHQSLPCVGYAEDVERTGRREIAAFFHKNYGPANLTISIVGDVKPEQVRMLPSSDVALPRAGCGHGLMPLVLLTRCLRYLTRKPADPMAPTSAGAPPGRAVLWWLVPRALHPPPGRDRTVGLGER